jgi:hypothetical protein
MKYVLPMTQGDAHAKSTEVERSKGRPSVVASAGPHS